MVIYNAIGRILTPTDIHYNGMIVFAVVGVIVNFGAALVTREGDSLNQKAVNLHMLEDEGEHCHEEHCHVEVKTFAGHHHHHHHHH
jgi:hypothetical protein